MDYYESYRTSKPRVLDEILDQQIDNCWTIGLSRHLTGLGRTQGILHEKESLSIQYLFNGVCKDNLFPKGAIDNLLSAKPFLINEGTVLDRLCPLTYKLGAANEAVEINASRFKVEDLIVHRVEEYENLTKFNDDLLRCLRRSPVAIAVPVFESFGNIGSEIYAPRIDELEHVNVYHVMLLTGLGRMNGVRFLEAQDSKGKDRGVEGYIKIAMNIPFVSHFVEIKGLHCTPPNPKLLFKPVTTLDTILHTSYVDACRAHCIMLASKSFIADSERDEILKGLDTVRLQITERSLEIYSDVEDVQMNVEAGLTNAIGDLAKKLQRGVSVNDMSATVSRIWCRNAICFIISTIKNLQIALVQLALKNKTLIITSLSTNLRKAYSVSLAHILLAYVEQLDRDCTRYLECQMRLNFCPLGSCDFAGSYLPIDRSGVAQALEFTGPMRNSIDAVTDRDFVVDLLHSTARTATHLSGLAATCVLWSSEECGFINSSCSVSNGSCIMQQRYPHPMEIVRQKVERVKGFLCIGLNTKELSPLTYDYDFQDDRRLLFDSFSTIAGMIKLSVDFLLHASFNEERIKKCLPVVHLSEAILVTYLEQKGFTPLESMDFVDNIVSYCVLHGRKVESVSVEDLKQKWPIFGDLENHMIAATSLNLFRSEGSAGADSIDTQLTNWMLKLGMTS
ncbi:unnamed protein product [Arabidopsis arenosa]|uniref:Uncharacterized protein n=1 Tax=Arabidopsis arenosa TaxID=38785 RepID=A0A8S2ATR4_ARAAE|nr:unnamed protein product [Arabidopsis arenosa]